jgi:hypothetical protein
MEWIGDCRMILLNEVAKKIEDILNGVDTEVINLRLNPPTNYYFKVATEGFHLDKIFDMPSGKNFIPVFISSMGGQFNPVPELLQANYVIPIAIYFPVRFKDDLFKLNEYLARVFVGRQLNYGDSSGKALSNVSVAQFGELIETDLKQFMEWEMTVYKKPVEKMEPYLQMTINLYLSTASEEFVYGNEATATLTIDHDDLSEENSVDEVVFTQNSIQSNSSPASQQMLDEKETESLPVNMVFGSSFGVYIKNNAFYKFLIKKWFDGDYTSLDITLDFNFLGEAFTRKVFIQSANLIIQKGELATITFSFSKMAEIEEEDNG